ncbi:MAG: fimbrial assembly protein [Gallionellaceae bacterium]|jgi:hypothetical protein
MSQQINLFNPLFLKQKKYFSVLAMLQALGLIMLGAGGFYAYALQQVNILARQTVDTAKRYETEQIRFNNFAREFSPRESGQALQNEVKKLEVALIAQKEILDTLKTGAIGNSEGYSEYMRAFARQKVTGLWLTGFEIDADGIQMSLYGAALRPQLVPVYIQRLSKEKIMRGKAFSSLQMQQPQAKQNQPVTQNYVEFRMHSTVDNQENEAEIEIQTTAAPELSLPEAMKLLPSNLGAGAK